MSSYDQLVVDEQPAAGPSVDTPRKPIVPGDPTLENVVKWAEAALPRVKAIEDYSCTLIERQRVGQTMVGPEYIELKVRNQPFSVYMKFLEPPSMRNQEVIYVEGRNDGKLLAHVNGAGRLLGTIALNPTSPLALNGNRYPITEIGLVRLIEHVIDIGRGDAKQPSDETELSYDAGVMVDDRPCTLIEVRHAVEKDDYAYHLAKIFVDEKLLLPVRFEAYRWPEEPGGPPVPIEEYTYVDLKLDNGFTDRDWDPANPQYGYNRGANAKRLPLRGKSLAREGLVAGQQ